MIRHIITITIIISFVYHSVTGVKAWDRADVERAPRYRHKYNRPVDEIYEAIPVAVVYEDRYVSDEKSLKNEPTTDTNESSVKDQNLTDNDNISVTFSRNAKVFKDEVVGTTSISESSIDIYDTEIMNKDKNIEIITTKNTDDIFNNFSVTLTEADEVTRKYENENFSKDHKHMMDTVLNKHSANENLANNPLSTSGNDEYRRQNIQLFSKYSTKEIHIPVVLIYDTDADALKNGKDQILAPSPTTQIPTTSTRKTALNRVNKQKQQKGFILRALNINKEEVETTTSHKPKTQKRQEEVQVENKIENKDHISVASKMKQISVTPQKIDLRSRTTEESVKSTNENSTKSGKKRRERDPVVPIIESNNQIYSHTGAFRFSYEGGDGTKAFSEGELKTFDNDKTGEAVVGGFSYKDKEGNDFSLSYTADENGYQPVGDHLPTPPPIPPAIARALRYLATKTTPEPVTESQKSETVTESLKSESAQNLD